MLTLDGTGDYVDLGTDSVFATGSSNFTVEAWIKTSYTGQRQEIFSFGATSAATNTAGVLYLDQTTGALRYGHAGVFGPTGAAVADGTWHHVAVTNTSGTMQLYVDGVASGSSQGMSPNFTVGGAEIGRNLYSQNLNFNGQIDDLRFWNTARSSSEIADKFRETLSGNQGGALVAHYTFDGDATGTGQTITDSAGSNNGTGQADATVSANAIGGTFTGTPVTSGPEIVNDLGKAIDFNNLYINAGRGPSNELAITGDMTAETWVRFDALNASQALLDFAQPGDGSSATNVLYQVNVDSSGNILYAHEYATGSNSPTLTFNTGLAVDRWYHVAFSRDAGTNDVSLYVNGELFGTQSYGSNDPTDGSSSVLVIGGNGAGSALGENRFDGQMGELRIWKTARTGDEIKSTYNQRLTGNENGDLVLNYTFDEVSGTTVSNTTGTTINGTASSTPSLVDLTAPVLGTAFSISEGETASGRMTAGDVTGTASYSISSAPSLGSVSIDSTSGQWTYTPPENYAGTQTFSVRATGGGLTDTETVTVTVSADAEVAVHGGAMQFDGANDYVDISSATSVFTGTSNFTWEAWINTSASGARQDIISIGSHAQNETAFFYVNSSGKLQVDLPSQTGVAGSTSVDDGNWHHVALSVNASGKVATLYVDGTAEGSKTFTGNAINLTEGHGAFIGKPVSFDGNYFDGMIDEVRIWNTLRTAQQITDNKDEQISSTQTNLVAHYTFDDVKGDVVRDSTSNAGHGTVGGPGPSPGVLTLDGINDYVDIPDSVLNARTTGTIEAWVLLDTNTSETITAKQHDGANTTAVFSVGDSFGGTADKLHFRPYNGAVATSTSTVSTGVWTHVAVTFDSSQAKFYIDGTLDATVSGNFSIPNIANATATTIGNLITGSGPYIGTGSVNSSFDGKLDEVRVWSDVRTATEIRDNMNAGVEGPEAGLVAAYSFDRDTPGSTGGVLNEQGTTSLNGTRTNGATVETDFSAPVTDMPKPLGGVSGNVLVLDGANDYMDVTNLGTGAISGAFTMEAWVKPDKFDAYAVVIDLFGSTAGETGLQISDKGVFNAWFTGSDTNVPSTYTLTLGEWSHLAVTFDGTNTAKLYADGELVATNTSITMTTLSGNINMHIGTNDDGASNPFDGQVDDARVWSVARTEAQIREGMSGAVDYDTTGLLAQYTFDDISGTTVVDNTVTSTNGALTSGATTADSGSGDPFFVNHLGTALSFDGTDDTVTFSSGIGPSGADERTIMLWAKTSSSAGQEFIRYGDGTNATFVLGLNSWNDTGGTQGVTVDTSSGAITFKPLTATDDGQWHHYAVVLPNGGSKLRDLKVYQDGVLLEAVVDLHDDANDTINTNPGAANMRLGSSGSGRYFNGQMAEVSVWSTGLSAGEIRDYMSSSLGGDETGLAGYWKLDEGTGTSIADSSTNSNTGTIGGSAAWASTNPDIQGSRIEIAEDSSASGQMTATDVSGTATYTLIGNPQNGTLDLDNSTGQWTYTPNADYQGTDTFTLRAAGSASGVDDETISVEVGKAPALGEDYAVSFGGTTSDYAVVSNVDNMGTSAITVETWFKSTDTDGAIFSYAAGSSDNELIIDLASSEISLWINDSNNDSSAAAMTTSGASLSDGAWHHVALTYDGTSAKLYLDGSSTATLTKTVGTSGALSAGGTIVFAQDQDTVGGGFQSNASLNAELNDARVWNTVRTGAEIAANYDRELTGDESGLVGYWKFDDKAGTGIKDSSGNANDGSVHGGATFKNLVTVPVSSSATYKGMILGEDADADGLSYALASSPANHNGTFALDGNKFTYTNDGTEGEDTFTVNITDDQGETTAETVTFVVS